MSAERGARKSTKGRAKGAKKERRARGRGNGRGTVYELPSGNYRWQFTLHFTAEGKRVLTGGTQPTRTAAEKALAQAIADHERGLLLAPDRVTVAEYADRWLSRQKELRDLSARGYRTELAYALERIGRLKVREVEPHHVKDLMAALADKVMQGGRGKGKPMSRRTQGKVLTRLKALFREAVSDRIIHTSPAEGARKVKAPSPEAVGRVLDFHEAARFAEVGAALDGLGLCRLWCALFTAVSVGLRKGELAALRWPDVDLERGLLRVRHSRTGVGKPENTAPKSRHSARHVHLPASLKAALVAHLERQRLEREEALEAWTDTGAVFATALGTHIHPRELNRALNALLAWSDPKTLERRMRYLPLTVTDEGRAGLRVTVMAGSALPHLCVHDLRHTYATLALRRGVPVEVVSKTLGHARVSITMDIYRHVLDSERRQHVIDLFDAPAPVIPFREAA